jgi:hypothetical protein
MRDKKTIDNERINPETQRAHRHQLLWQVTVPFILGVTVFLAFVILIIVAGVQGEPRIGQWGDVSLIWLIMPTMLFLLILLAVFGGLLYLVLRLNNAMPGFMKKAQDFFRGMAEVAEKASDVAVEPVIKAESSRVAVKTLFSRERNNEK